MDQLGILIKVMTLIKATNYSETDACPSFFSGHVSPFDMKCIRLSATVPSCRQAEKATALQPYMVSDGSAG